MGTRRPFEASVVEVMTAEANLIASDPFNQNHFASNGVGLVVSGAPFAQPGDLSGNKYAWQVWSGTNSTSTAGAWLDTSPFTVIAGATVSVYLRYRVTSGSLPITVTAQWYDSNGLPLTSATLWSGTWSTTTDTAITATGTVPAYAAACRLRIGTTTPAASASATGVQFGQVFVRCGTAPATGYTTPVWRDLTELTAMTIEEGHELDGVEDVPTGGTLTATLLSTTLSTATDTTLARGRPIRARSVAANGDRITFWSGWIDSTSTNWDDTKTSTRPAAVTITATDAMRRLAAAVMPILRTATGTTDTSNTTVLLTTAIHHAATIAGVPITTPTWLEAHTAMAATIYAVDSSATGTDWLRRCLNRIPRSSGVTVFCDNSGGSVGTYSFAAAIANVWDTGGNISPVAANITRGVDLVTNVLTVTRINVNEADDNGSKNYGPYVAAASVLANGARTGGVEIAGGDPATIAAQALGVYALLALAPTSVQVNALGDVAGTTSDPLTYTLSRIAPGQGINVKHAAAGLASTAYRILRVAHTIDTDQWLITATLRPERGTAPAITTPVLGASTGTSDILTPPAAPSVTLAKSGTQTLTTGAAYTQITGWSTTYNTDADSSTNAFDLTISDSIKVNKAGIYHIEYSVVFAANSTGNRAAGVYVNGVNASQDLRAALAGNSSIAGRGVDLKLAAGAVVDLRAWQSSGASLAVNAATLSVTWQRRT